MLKEKKKRGDLNDERGGSSKSGKRSKTKRKGCVVINEEGKERQKRKMHLVVGSSTAGKEDSLLGGGIADKGGQTYSAKKNK